MISQEELGLLKAKQEGLEAKRDELKAEISRLEADKQEMIELNSKVMDLESEIETDEGRQMAELESASSELRKLRGSAQAKPKMSNNQKKKIKKLTNENKSLQNKLQTLKSSKEEQKSIASQNETSENNFREEITIQEEVIQKIEHIKRRIPPMPTMYAIIEDYHANIDYIGRTKNQLNDSLQQYTVSRAILNESNTSLESTLSELEEMLCSIEKLLPEMNRQKEEKYAQLSAISGELQKLNQLMIEQQKAHEQKSVAFKESERELEKESRKQQSIVNSAKMAIATMPQTIEADKTEHGRVVIQKNKEISDLRKVLKDTKTEILARNSNSPSVMQKTSLLEEEWRTHQDINEQLQRELDARRKRDDILQRKRIASSEIEQQWPQPHAGIEPGLPELNKIFIEAQAMNRDLAKSVTLLRLDYDAIADNLRVLEELINAK